LAINDGRLKQSSIDAWLAACRLRIIIDVWRTWMQRLQSTGDADPGAAFRLAETAACCVDVLMKLGVDLDSFRGRERGEILASLPREPCSNIGWQQDLDYVSEQLDKLDKLYPLQSELIGVMIRLVLAPSAACLVGKASELPEVHEVERAGPGSDLGGSGRDKEAGAGRAPVARAQERTCHAEANPATAADRKGQELPPAPDAGRPGAGQGEGGATPEGQQPDGPFGADGFRFDRVEVRFGRAALQYRLMLELWDRKKKQPAKPRPTEDVVTAVYGGENETADATFRQLISDTRGRLEKGNFPLSIRQLNGKVELYRL
jgi:hypothetical protein